MTTTTDPELELNLLSENSRQAIIIPTQWIVHTAVDAPGPTDLHGYFENHTNLESHTWLRWDRHEQLMEFNRRADANNVANRFHTAQGWCGAISTETEDDGSPVENPWNDYQLEELIRFGVWLHRTFGIPIELPKHEFAPGMGYHSLHRNWSVYAGKTCPGATRIDQFKTIVLPGIRAALTPTIPTEDEAMFDIDLKEHIAEVYDVSQELNTNDKRGQLGWVGNIGSNPDAKEARASLEWLHAVAELPW